MNNKTPHCVPDFNREERIGFAEVVYCQGKTDGQLIAVASALLSAHRNVLFSRCSPEQYQLLSRNDQGMLSYHTEARIAALHEDKADYGRGVIAVVSAGTTDIPVAEEAAVTAEVMGNRVERHYDIGVAGIHRLLERRDALAKA